MKRRVLSCFFCYTLLWLHYFWLNTSPLANWTNWIEKESDFHVSPASNVHQFPPEFNTSLVFSALFFLVLDIRDNMWYGTSVAFPCTDSRQTVSLTPGALSEPHSMQLYHPYSGQDRPRCRHQLSCCGCGWSASWVHWRMKLLSFCLPAPPGSREIFVTEMCKKFLYHNLET